MTASTRGIHQDVDDDESFRLYDWAFYIHEPHSGRHVLWDVGISGVMSYFILIMSSSSCSKVWLTDPYAGLELARIGTTTSPRSGGSWISCLVWGRSEVSWNSFGPWA